jgi:hypothetical protein
MIRYHRKGIRTDWRSRCAGRPETAAEIRDLIRRMNSANPLWRAPRIQGELLKFAIAVNQPTIRSRSLKRRRQAWAPGGRLSHSWSRFRDRFSRASDRTCPGKARGTRDRHVTFSTVSRSANMNTVSSVMSRSSASSSEPHGALCKTQSLCRQQLLKRIASVQASFDIQPWQRSARPWLYK